MRLKLIINRHKPFLSRLIDAETDELVDNVIGVKWEWEGDKERRMAVLTIRVANVEIAGE